MPRNEVFTARIDSVEKFAVIVKPRNRPLSSGRRIPDKYDLQTIDLAREWAYRLQLELPDHHVSLLRGEEIIEFLDLMRN